MKLGILVNTDRHIDDIIGIAKAALLKGHEIIIFNMDSGTKLLENPAFIELCSLKGISISFCDYSSKKEKAKAEGLPVGIVAGSQYNNACMVNEADKVIVL